MFDWFSFLRQHNIPHTTTGPNASRGRVNIKCPFCGADDPSEHMGISLAGRGWSCWRNNQHRGRSAPRLIAAMLRCSLADATQLAGGEVRLPTDDDFLSTMRERLSGEFGLIEKPTVLQFPNEFKSMANGSPFAVMFYDYFKRRGYKDQQITWLVREYDLQYATSGRFQYRVIIPFFDRWRELLTWTGRSIRPQEELRYKALSHNEQICSPKDTLLGLPLLWTCANPRVLLIVEGPFDAFWVTTFGRALGVYATCLSGLSMSPPQINSIIELQSRFDYVALLLDSEARMQAFRLAQSGLGLGIERLPTEVKDPAEWPSGAVVDFCLELLNRTSAA